MKRAALSLFLLIAFLSTCAMAQNPWWLSPILNKSTVAKLPTVPSVNNTAYTGFLWYVSDGINLSDCTTGGGSVTVLCTYTGTAWVPAFGGSGGAGSVNNLLITPAATGTGVTLACGGVGSDTNCPTIISGKGSAGAQIVPPTTLPFTNFTTLNAPNNLAAPAAVTDANNTVYWSEIFIPQNVTLTGACWLNGATVTTDKHQVELWNASGTLLANSAAAGVADSGNASIYQCAAFSPGTVAVTGPASYFVGIASNGTTDTFFTYTTGGAPTNYVTGTAAQTFGTAANITPGTTFTTAKGPLMMVY